MELTNIRTHSQTSTVENDTAFAIPTQENYLIFTSLDGDGVRRIVWWRLFVFISLQR